MSTPAPVVDPWLDPFTSLGRDSYFEDISKVAADEGFGAPDAPAPNAPDAPAAPLLAEEVTPPAAPPGLPAEPEEDQPLVFELEGGSTARMERTSKGWTGTLDPGGDAKPEIFYGKTKNELLGNLMKAKLNATKKIREQEYKLKLGDPAPRTPEPPAAPPAAPVAVHEMTAEERFEYKTLLESDPVRAHDFYNEKRYGLSPEQFAQRLNKVEQIERQSRANEADSVAWRFVEQNPDYYRDEQGENYLRMVRYLARNIGRTVTKTNIPQTVEALYDAGFWTLEHLDAAKEDLTESGLLLRKPAAPTPVAPAPPAAPAAVTPPQEAPKPPEQPPAPPTPIAPVERPRAANLGLRVQPAASATPAAPTALSVDDPDSLTDDQIQAALKAYRRR